MVWINTEMTSVNNSRIKRIDSCSDCALYIAKVYSAGWRTVRRFSSSYWLIVPLWIVQLLADSWLNYYCALSLATKLSKTGFSQFSLQYILREIRINFALHFKTIAMVRRSNTHLLNLCIVMIKLLWILKSQNACLICVVDKPSTKSWLGQRSELKTLQMTITDTRLRNEFLIRPFPGPSCFIPLLFPISSSSLILITWEVNCVRISIWSKSDICYIYIVKWYIDS